MDISNQILASSVYRALGILGDRTTLIILEYAFIGVKRFSDWQQRMAIARSTLTSRLGNLVENGVMEKVRYQEQSARYEYHLTKMGLGLYPSALMGWRWEDRWHRHRIVHPRNLHHRSCGQSMKPVMICSHCKEKVRAHDVSYKDGPGAGYDKRFAPRHTRRSREIGSDLYEICDIVGDRWAALILAMAFFRIRRFDDMQKQQKMASNILTDRLERLVKSNLLARRKYQDRPARYEYILTEVSMDFYTYIVSMLEWGDRWLAGPGKEPLLLKHSPCRRRLKAKVVCNECAGVLKPKAVNFQQTE